ncbi:MAG: hypothetical protein ACFFBS_07270 [Promethearchaeota archaeon]
MDQENLEMRHDVRINLEHEDDPDQEVYEKISTLEERINTIHLRLEVLIQEIAFLKNLVLSVKETSILNKDEIGFMKGRMATKADVELLRKYAKTIARIEAKLGSEETK